MDSLAQQRRASLGGGRGVGADAQGDRVAAQVPSGAGREQRVGWAPGSLAQPTGQHAPDRGGWGPASLGQRDARRRLARGGGGGGALRGPLSLARGFSPGAPGGPPPVS